MKLRFLGTSACFPEDGGDSPSLLINDTILVDTGWHPLENLARAGVAPQDLKLILFTHMHHDPYMGLTNLYFRYLMTKDYPFGDLTVAGPAEDVGKVSANAMEYLQADRFWPGHGVPTILPLTPGQSFEIAGCRFETHISHHPVSGLLYRVTDLRDVKALCLTGDTEYFPEQANFFRGGDAIVSETALGNPKSTGSNHYGHSAAFEAVQVADAARVPQMFCIHLIPERLRNTVASAQELRAKPFTAEYPEPYREYDI